MIHDCHGFKFLLIFKRLFMYLRDRATQRNGAMERHRGLWSAGSPLKWPQRPGAPFASPTRVGGYQAVLSGELGLWGCWDIHRLAHGCCHHSWWLRQLHKAAVVCAVRLTVPESNLWFLGHCLAGPLSVCHYLC